MQQTDSRDRAKGLLKVMPSFVTAGEEKEYPQGLSSDRPEMMKGDRETQRKRGDCVGVK